LFKFNFGDDYGFGSGSTGGDMTLFQVALGSIWPDFF